MRCTGCADPLCPLACPCLQEVCDLLMRCLSEDAAQRPTSLQLLQELGPLIERRGGPRGAAAAAAPSTG